MNGYTLSRWEDEYLEVKGAEVLTYKSAGALTEGQEVYQRRHRDGETEDGEREAEGVVAEGFQGDEEEHTSILKGPRLTPP